MDYSWLLLLTAGLGLFAWQSGEDRSDEQVWREGVISSSLGAAGTALTNNQSTLGQIIQGGSAVFLGYGLPALIFSTG